MSADGDQQRRPGAPDDTDGKRRLRAVSYPDPYLVTKLPMEATVNSGVIRLGERMLLGFIHRPYPDGTRVRVVYDEWLFAERIDEDRGVDESDQNETAAAAKFARKRGKAGASKSAGKARAAPGSGKGAGKGDVAESSDVRATTAAGKVEPAKPTEGTPASTSRLSPEEEAADRPGSDEDSDSANRFPDDFGGPERQARGERDSAGDAWTETFDRSDQED